MASLSLPTPAEAPAPQPGEAGAAGPRDDVVLVAGFGSPVDVDYAAFARRQGGGRVTLTVARAGFTGLGRAGAVVIFLPPRLTDFERRALDDLLDGSSEARFVGIVSTFRVHLGDRHATEAEEYALGRAKNLPARTVVFRPGYVLSPGSRTSVFLRRFGPCYPLVPKRLRGCCVDGDELFAAIESERLSPRPGRRRAVAVLGPNRPWREWLAEHRGRGIVPAGLTGFCALLSLLIVGHLAGLLLGLFARRRPRLRAWAFDTFRPRSFRELRALCNPYNARHVKVVGYNNGVNHFGHRYPGQTVVSTVRLNRVGWVAPDVIRADCGATVRRALDFLAGAGRTLYVVPNFSYVCLGTAYFVPIHGSAADFSCLAETITRVLLYDPATDRLIAAGRDEPAFREHVYNPASGVVLLRLDVRVKPQSRYFLRRGELEDPDSGAILAALRDERATNVEVRKANAAGTKASVARFYNDPGDSQSPVLELPRDALGRLWDRLEENPVTAFLMHALTRHLAWHVELFFTAEEFATFWADHRALPLRKIQLRAIRRDGFPHSPFRDHDCVSADMFMLRRHRRMFEDYLRRTFAVVRSNPGKHSS
jgi:hypothetical protein